MTPEQARTLAATVKRKHVKREHRRLGSDPVWVCDWCGTRWPCDAAALADTVETLTAPPRSDEIADRCATLVGQALTDTYGRMRVGYLAAIRDYRIETGVGLKEAKDAIDAALTRRDEAARR